MVVDYHRSLRSFLPDKAKQSWGSSFIYFLWNLLLIAPRVAALALFASVLRGYIAAHFVMLWFVFVLWAWQQKTEFMDSIDGEWLYRATVGLIWYFSWFNVAEGQTRARSLIYHFFITSDGVILLLTWWLYRDPFQTESYDLPLIITLPLTYLLGLLFKALYYCCFHPKLWRPPLRDPRLSADMPDAQVPFRDFSIQDSTLSSQLLNKRMACHATNFFSEQRNTESTKRAESSYLWSLTLCVSQPTIYYSENITLLSISISPAPDCLICATVLLYAPYAGSKTLFQTEMANMDKVLFTLYIILHHDIKGWVPIAGSFLDLVGDC